ncbi:MAG TPA: alpha-amylase/4-alpha-glucanotransferase domain-containing protein, partial [Gemmatimonadales bacterium]|nr:alpha-amylase/4-alpha-glucanotransferase domain-containing protein [Gemmatimonadales bacterium]
GDYWPVRSWARSACRFRIETRGDSLDIICASVDGPELEKRLAFSREGNLQITYRWDQAVGQPDDAFAPELSLFAPLELRPEPDGEIWTYTIETVAKSERGLDRTKQGESVTVRWPVRLGGASLMVEPASRRLLAALNQSSDLSA